MKLQKNETLRFSVIQIAYSIASAGIIVTYLVPLYKSFGFSVSKIGVLTAIAYISSIVAEPVLGKLCDGKRKTSKVITLAMIIGLIAFSLIFFLHERMILIVPAVILLYCTTPSLAYLISQWSVNIRNSGTQINFGVSRAAGSLGYGIFAAVFGNMIDSNGYKIILPAFVVFSLITIILLMSVKEPSVLIQEKIQHRSIKELFASKQYMLLAVSAFFTFVGSYCITVFLSLRIEEIGGSVSSYGIVILIEGIVEVIAILMYEKVADRLSNYKVMLICFILSFVASIIMSFAESLRTIYIGMVIHGLFTGLYVAGIAFYITEIVSKNMVFTAAMSVASCLSIAGAVSSFYVAIITGFVSLQAAMKIMVIMPALAIITFIVSGRRGTI